MIFIPKGDYLVFAAIGRATGLTGLYPERCEIRPGIYRRHWDLLPTESRSDISRDGYLGVLFMALVLRDAPRIHRILTAGMKTWWQMGERGNKDYTNIWPLAPLLFRAVGISVFPTIPTLPIGKMTTGYRAHLLALTILIERLTGKRKSIFHKWAISSLVKNNPDNPLFRAMYNNINNLPTDYTLLDNFNYEEAAYGWGSCPGHVFHALTSWVIHKEPR